MRRGQWTIHTTEKGKPYQFHTVAGSESEALRLFRRTHPRWRVSSITPPAFPVEKAKNTKGEK